MKQAITFPHRYTSLIRLANVNVVNRHLNQSTITVVTSWIEWNQMSPIVFQTNCTYVQQTIKRLHRLDVVHPSMQDDQIVVTMVSFHVKYKVSIFYFNIVSIRLVNVWTYKIGNECLRHINCTCRGLKNTNQPICGHQLNGPGCLDHMVYQCRLIGSPTPLIDCRHSSCVNGRCSIDSRATTIESKQEQERLLPNVTSNEHEEEYVTFAPLIRVPFKFDPWKWNVIHITLFKYTFKDANKMSIIFSLPFH